MFGGQSFGRKKPGPESGNLPLLPWSQKWNMLLNHGELGSSAAHLFFSLLPFFFCSSTMGVAALRWTAPGSRVGGGSSSKCRGLSLASSCTILFSRRTSFQVLFCPCFSLFLGWVEGWERTLCCGSSPHHIAFVRRPHLAVSLRSVFLCTWW